MNTRASVYYGWVFFTLCGAGGYYFAKRSIHADRNERQRRATEESQRRNRHIAASTHSKSAETSTSSSSSAAPQSSKPTSSSADAERDGAAGKSNGSDGNPASIPPESKPRYESQTPFRSKKGDRFS